MWANKTTGSTFLNLHLVFLYFFLIQNICEWISLVSCIESFCYSWSFLLFLHLTDACWQFLGFVGFVFVCCVVLFCFVLFSSFFLEVSKEQRADWREAWVIWEMSHPSFKPVFDGRWHEEIKKKIFPLLSLYIKPFLSALVLVEAIPHRKSSKSASL